MNAAYRQSAAKAVCPVSCFNCGQTVGISKSAEAKRRRNPDAVRHYCFVCGEASRRAEALAKQLEGKEAGPRHPDRLELESVREQLKSRADRRKNQ